MNIKNIPINAQVECLDGHVGISVAVIINPIKQLVTHFVIEDQTTSRNVERLVPLKLVAKTTPNEIFLQCTRAELDDCDIFSEIHYIPNEDATVEYLEPYVTPLDLLYTTIETERIPPGELAVRRGCQVEAVDGNIGTIDKFLVDPEDGNITHLVLQKGHFWGKKELTLPVSAIERIDQNTVYLGLSHAELAILPTIPIKRDQQNSADIEVLIWIFSGLDTATQGLNRLKEMVKTEKIRLRNSAVLTKDNDGNTAIEEAENLDPRQGALFGAITGGILGLLGGPAGVVFGAAAGALTGGAAAHWMDIGFDNESLKNFQINLHPNNSALILLVDKADICLISSAMDEFNGQRVQPEFVEEMVQKLMSSHNEAPGEAE